MCRGRHDDHASEVSCENIDDVFDDAGRRIGDEGLHKEWKARRRDGIDNTRAKLELVALSMDPAVRKKLELPRFRGR